jgi:hypothetical protein
MEQAIQIKLRCSLPHYPLKQTGHCFWKRSSKQGPGNEKCDVVLSSVLLQTRVATIEMVVSHMGLSVYGSKVTWVDYCSMLFRYPILAQLLHFYELESDRLIFKKVNWLTHLESPGEWSV